MKEGVLFHRQLACVDSLAPVDSDGLSDKMASLAIYRDLWPYKAVFTASSPAGWTSSMGFPLKSALKTTRDVTKDVKHAKTVSFCEPVKSVRDDVGRALTNEDVQVMKQAVVAMGDHPEELVQLAIEAQNLLHEEDFLFETAAELCQRADVLAHDLLAQEDLRIRITEIKKKLGEEEEEGGEVEKIPDNGSTVNDSKNNNNGNDDDDDDTNNVKNIGARAEREPFAGMPECGQRTAAETSSTSSASFSSSSSSVSSFAPASLPASSSPPSSSPSFASFDAWALSLETVSSCPTAASLFPSLFALAPPSSPTPPSAPWAASPSSCASPASTTGITALRETGRCLLSGMSGDAREGLEVASRREEPAQPRDHGDAENAEGNAQDVPQDASSVAAEEAGNVVAAAAALSSLAQSPAEMSVVGAEESCGRDAKPTSGLSGSSATDPQGSSCHSGSRSEAAERLKALVRDNRRLKERKMCRACKKVDLSESGITFLPCGHFITCESCSEKFDDCPACGKNIMGTVRTFLS